METETPEPVLCTLKNIEQPCLVWLSASSARLQTKVSLVRFPVRARAWVAGQVPKIYQDDYLVSYIMPNHWVVHLKLICYMSAVIKK